MSIEGVWKVEMKGPYGWEKIATAFLQDGRYWTASADHYSTGSYAVDGDAFTAEVQATQYGKVHTLYGSKKKQLSIRIEANIKNEGKIVGRSHLSTSKKFDTKVRLTRLGDLS